MKNDFRYGPHTKKRMAERGITDADIDAVMTNPVGVYQPPTGKVELTGYGLDGKPILVVTNGFMDFVISVMLQKEGFK